MPIPGGEIGEAIISKHFASEEWEREYITATGELKAISDYTGLSIKEVLDLPYSLFLLYRRDTWIQSLRGSEQGQELLKTLWRLKQTKADEKAIRNFTERRNST